MKATNGNKMTVGIEAETSLEEEVVHIPIWVKLSVQLQKPGCVSSMIDRVQSQELELAGFDNHFCSSFQDGSTPIE